MDDAKTNDIIDLFIKYPEYKKIYECFIELAVTEIQKDAIGKIMKYGVYNNFKVNSMLSNKKTDDFAEMKRRVAFCELILFNEELFFEVVDKGLNVFHGTVMDALNTILTDGIICVSKLTENNTQLKTGEDYFRTIVGIGKNAPKRDFISLTDSFDTCVSYASFGNKNDINSYVKNINNKELYNSLELIIYQLKKIPLVICLNGAEVGRDYGESLIYVDTSLVEIGCKSDIKPSYIKCLITTYDKVDYVKSLVSQYGIDVLGYDSNNTFGEILPNQSGQFYGIYDSKIVVDEQKFENSKDMIKESIRKIKEDKPADNIIPNINDETAQYILDEEASIKIATIIKMDLIYDLMDQYNRDGSFIPITEDDLVLKYCIDKKVAQQLARDVNESLELFIKDKDRPKENFSPLF